MRSQRKRGNNLKTRDGEFGDEFDETRIFLQPHQLPQLVVGLESHHQTTELVVALTVCQSLRERERSWCFSSLRRQIERKILQKFSTVQ